MVIIKKSLIYQNLYDHNQTLSIILKSEHAWKYQPNRSVQCYGAKTIDLTIKQLT